MHAPPTSLIDRPAEHSATAAARPTTSCSDLAVAVGQLEIRDPLFAGSLLSSAVNEYAAQAGRPWTFDPATPPAVLLRAIARLATSAPRARSASASVLLDAADRTLRDVS